MSKYWSELIKKLDPYVPGEQPKDLQYIKLNTNENPYPPSPKVLAAIQAASSERLRLYPDPNADSLKAALASHYRLEKQQIFAGNGSDEVLGFAFLAFFKQAAPILFPDISYSFYPVYANLFEIEAVTIPLNAEFAIEPSAYRRANGGIIIPNPNAPTGRGLELAEIEELLKANREVVVVIDEAYIDFGGQTAVPLLGQYDNLLIVQTFSKSRSLAGLRVGMAFGSPELIAGLERVKNSFNSYPLDSLALAGAVAAIEDGEYFEQTRERIIATREWASTELRALAFEVLPSQANFLFIRHRQKAAAALYRELRGRGILVRHFNLPRIDNFLRVTVGTNEEMRTLVEVLRALA